MLVRDTRTRRVLIDSDVKNEADDQFAVVHALLSPTLDIRGIIPAHFGAERTAASQQESRAELELLLELMGRTGTVPIADGAAAALPDEETPVDSPGARLLIEEALRKDEGPLFTAFLGPLTDMASAILLAPEITESDTTVIWIGGPPYGDHVQAGRNVEFNLGNDIAAANVVFGSGMRVWQVTAAVYRQVNIGYAELRRRVAPHGRLGGYLAQQVVDFNTAHHKVAIESRSLGDSPAIGLMLDPMSGLLRRQPPVRFTTAGAYQPSHSGSDVMVVERVDVRFLLEDMFAKIQDFAEGTVGDAT